MVEPLEETTIDYKIFEVKYNVPGLMIPLKETHKFIKLLSPYFLHLGQKGFLSKAYSDKGFNLILLSEKLIQENKTKPEFEKDPSGSIVDGEKISTLFSELATVKKFIEDSKDAIPHIVEFVNIWPLNLKKIIIDFDLPISKEEVTLGYEDLSYNEAIRKLLPENVVPPTSYETIGTLAHLNLRPNHLPYKKIIGKVLLDKNRGIKTVVNKVTGLNNVFRTPELEILAGENNYVTELKEGKCIFELSYDKGKNNKFKIWNQKKMLF